MGVLENKIEALRNTYKKKVLQLKNYCQNNFNRIRRSRMPNRYKSIYINRVRAYYRQKIRVLQNQLKLDIRQARLDIHFSQENKNTHKKALLIGCNYNRTPYRLRGCINDVINLQNLLRINYGFYNTKLLTDNTSLKPTKQIIINEIVNLLKNSESGDVLYISFSGHGTYTRDQNNDEKDGRDEMFVSLDLQCIKDDDMKKLIQDNLKPDVNVFILFDCCHSGTILDLKYQYLDSSEYNKATQNNNEETLGNIYMISGCKDNQTSADAYINRKFQGAMTWALIESLKNKSSLTWKQLLLKMRYILKRSRFSQVPQLSSGKTLDINSKFLVLN